MPTRIVASQRWRKASQACLVFVPRTDAALKVLMIDRLREIALSRSGSAGRELPRKLGNRALEGTLH